MRAIVLSLAVLLSTAAFAAPSAVVPDANAPKGKLPDTVSPAAYRLDFTILPEADRFSGHDEIDIMLNRPESSIYMHGRDLTRRHAALALLMALPLCFYLTALDTVEGALVAGLNSVGVDAVLVGVMPTPAVAYLTARHRASFGVVVATDGVIYGKLLGFPRISDPATVVRLIFYPMRSSCQRAGDESG